MALRLASAHLLLLCLLTPAIAQKRVALVIGNSAYQHAPALANPKNDATDMAAALKRLGFQVIDGFDLDKVSLERKVRDFSTALQGADVGLFYYAGHGLQVAGQNYLVPVDAKAEAADAVDWEMVRLDLVQRTMERATATNIIFLDACRNNPLGRNLARAMGTRSTEIGRGLAPVESGVGTLISFSTQPGNVALDGVGQRNSPFAGSLVKHVSTSSDDLSAVLIAVRNDVMQQTQRKQIPWEHSALTGRFYFKAPTATMAPSQLSEAERAWDKAKDTTNINVLDAFIRRYGDTFYGDVAKARIVELREAERVRLALPKADEERRQPKTSDPALSVKPGSGESFRDCPTCPEMVVVPAGRFTMGAPEDEPGRSSNEGPQREVTMAHPFAVGKFEVTRGEFEAFARETGYQSVGGCAIWVGSKWELQADKSWRSVGFAQTDNHPVACVSWEEAKKYVAWLSHKSSKSYRLLSEAEWEYAARAGTTTPFWWGSSIGPAQANYNDRGPTYGSGGTLGEYRQKTVAVDTFAANAWGLYNVLGNVWEWVEDCWHEEFNDAPRDGSAWTECSDGRRVLRGGAWSVFAMNLRSASRFRYAPNARSHFLGFRLGRAVTR